MTTSDGQTSIRTERLRETIQHYFGVQDDADVESILAELEPEALPGGEWLFRAGDTGASLYFIQRGRLQVWGEADADGTGRLFGELGPGEIVGEVSLLTGGTRSAGIRAIRDTSLLRMSREAFDRLAAAHPSLAIEMAAQIARRLRDRTSARRTTARGPENLVVLPLDDEPGFRQLAGHLATALEVHGSIARLGKETRPSDDDTSLGDWLHTRETLNDYLLLEADPALSPWSRLCLRHADLLILVGSGGSPPSAGAFAEATRRGTTAARRVLVLVHDSDQVAHGAAWRAAIDPDLILHVRTPMVERDVARLARILTGNAIGLVLGGGAARGFAHMGVHRALLEADVPIDWVGGTSIGSVFSATIALDWTPERIEALARTAFVEENPLGDYTLPLVALLRGRRLQRLVEEHFATDIDDLPIPYFCVSTHLEQGEIQVHEHGPLWRAIRASVALPGVLPPAIVDGELSIDGGVLNNLPVDVMRSRGVGRVIAVDLSLREDSMIDFEEIPGPLEILRSRVLPSRRGNPVPSILYLLVKASMGASAAHTRAMRREADLLLQPPVAPFGLLDVKAMDRLIEVGYAHARERLIDWKAAAQA